MNILPPPPLGPRVALCVRPFAMLPREPKETLLTPHVRSHAHTHTLSHIIATCVCGAPRAEYNENPFTLHSNPTSHVRLDGAGVHRSNLCVLCIWARPFRQDKTRAGFTGGACAVPRTSSLSLSLSPTPTSHYFHTLLNRSKVKLISGTKGCARACMDAGEGCMIYLFSLSLWTHPYTDARCECVGFVCVFAHGYKWQGGVERAQFGRVSWEQDVHVVINVCCQ